jgi:hypothetical protein
MADSFFEQIADSIIASDEVQKRRIQGSMSKSYRIAESRLRTMLAEAAKMGAEATLAMMPEHDVEMVWVCGVCREAIVAKDIDENHTIWVHAHDTDS